MRVRVHVHWTTMGRGTGGTKFWIQVVVGGGGEVDVMLYSQCIFKNVFLTAATRGTVWQNTIWQNTVKSSI